MAAQPRLWHVTVTVSGTEVPTLVVRRALQRLGEQQPFLRSLRYSGERAELQYFEEAEDLLDAASLALRVWREHREPAGLPQWEVVGLEVLERRVYADREPSPQPVAAPEQPSLTPF